MKVQLGMLSKNVLSKEMDQVSENDWVHLQQMFKFIIEQGVE